MSVFVALKILLHWAASHVLYQASGNDPVCLWMHRKNAVNLDLSDSRLFQVFCNEECFQEPS